MAQAQHFSTDALPVRDRFAYWREERGKFLGVTIDLDKDQQAQFHGSFSARPLGGATLVDMRASSYRVARTEADIADRPAFALVARLSSRSAHRYSHSAQTVPKPEGTTSADGKDRHRNR